MSQPSTTVIDTDRRAEAAAGLADRIAWAMKDHYTHEILTGVLASLGLDPSACGSKRERVTAALAGLAPERVARIAIEAAKGMDDLSLADAGERFLEEGGPPLSEITRRDVAHCFGHDLAGARDLVEMLHPLFVLEDPATIFLCDSLADDLRRFACGAEPVWDAERVLVEIGALACSRARFGELLAAAVHPLARRNTAQSELVARINAVLVRDGYALVQDGEESGYPVYRLANLRRGVAGLPKNLIFASIGPKPRIALADAINNDIVILEHADSCLVYDRPIGRDGLRWSELVEWWRAMHPEEPNPAKSFGARLTASLASDGERTLFAEYFRQFRGALGEHLPALVPQVYLHYDPETVRQLAGRDGLLRQRMDFLLLLPNRQRVVLEVDGSQHFAAEDGTASLASYAAMMAADRDLRLAGYEIFRFGANEVVGARAPGLIGSFFARLFDLHRIR